MINLFQLLLARSVIIISFLFFPLVLLANDDLVPCGDGCHILESYLKDAEQKEHLLAFKHQIDWDVSCEDCHQRNAKQIAHEKKVFKSGEYDDPLYRREFSNAMCLNCHDDYDGLVDRTDDYKEVARINPHQNHLRQTDCSNCHRVHRKSRFTCSECHKSTDWKSVLPTGWQVAD